MLLATIFFYVFLAAALCFSGVYYSHMFQLEAYLPAQFFHWLKDNFFRNLFLKFLPALAAVILLALLTTMPTMVIASLLLIAYAVLFRPVKAKKPLVFTARIWRLLTTYAVLCAVICAAVSFAGLIFLAPAAVIIAPLILLAANWINRPAELAVRRHYINQAKAIIKARKKTLTVIGITGSYGKTSTKYFLTKVLSQKFNVLMTPASYNTTMGVVKVIREMLKPSHEIFVCEMGARNVGEIKEICDIVLPDYGIITSIGPQHLETFKSIENIINTKFELADAVGEKNHVFLNADNRYIYERRYDSEYIYYGMENGDSAYFADKVRTTSDGTSFEFISEKETMTLSSRLIGKHNVLNIAAACAVAQRLGVEKNDIVRAVKMLEPVPHRLQLIDNGDIVIIDDSFNSNPAGAKSALEALSCFDGVKVLVTPGMVELGESQDILNREFGTQASNVCSYIYIVGKVNYDSIFKGAKTTGFDVSSRLVSVSSPEQAISLARALPTDKRKIILLENDLPDNFN